MKIVMKAKICKTMLHLCWTCYLIEQEDTLKCRAKLWLTFIFVKERCLDTQPEKNTKHAACKANAVTFLIVRNFGLGLTFYITCVALEPPN